jgi:hypothetical protein
MNKFICLTTLAGTQIWIDPEKISVIDPYLSETLHTVVQVEGVRYNVQEAPDQVMDILNDRR